MQNLKYYFSAILSILLFFIFFGDLRHYPPLVIDAPTSTPILQNNPKIFIPEQPVCMIESCQFPYGIYFSGGFINTFPTPTPLNFPQPVFSINPNRFPKIHHM